MWVTTTRETPDWRSLLPQFLCVWSWSKCFCMVTYGRSFLQLSAHPPSLEKQYVFQPGAGPNLWPARRLSCDPPSVWESLVEGLMVIWSTLLNELTQPLTDVRCEGSALSSDPWIWIDYEWGSNNRTLSGLSQHAWTKRTSLNTSGGSLCRSSCFPWRGSKTF